MGDIVVVHSSDDEVVGEDDTGEGPQEDGVTVQKGQEPRGAGFELPGTDGEGEDGADVLAASDGEVAWEEGHDVVAERNGVAGNDVADVGEGEAEAGEEFRGAVVPDLDHFELGGSVLAELFLRKDSEFQVSDLMSSITQGATDRPWLYVALGEARRKMHSPGSNTLDRTKLEMSLPVSLQGG